MSIYDPERRRPRHYPHPIALEDDPVQDRNKPGVLVVDGDATVRALLHFALDRHGFAVFLAADGAEAFQQLRRQAARIDLALVELHLDDRDGLEVLAELKRMNPDVGCSVITGYLGRHTEDGLRAAGAHRVFYKPFSLEEVAGLLQGIVSSGRTVSDRCPPTELCPDPELPGLQAGPASCG